MARRSTTSSSRLAAGAAATLHAVLDDAAAGAAAIEHAAAFAQVLGRSLALVQLQDMIALQAAALPHTQALAHAAARWAPLAPGDVELGWRAEAARLRTLAGRIVPRHVERWSLQPVRGRWPQVAIELAASTELLLLGIGRAPGLPGAVWLLDDDGEGGARARSLALDLAQAIGVPLQLLPGCAGEPASLPGASRPPAVCVMPRDRLVPAHLIEQRHVPLLVV